MKNKRIKQRQYNKKKNAWNVPLKGAKLDTKKQYIFSSKFTISRSFAALHKNHQKAAYVFTSAATRRW